MVVIWGNQLYGRVDKLPGVFSVATRFFHLYYIPLIPTETWIIIDGTETSDGFRGRRIGLSGKSILMAWMRAAAVICCIGSVIWGLIAASQFAQKGDVTGPISAAGLFFSSLFMYWVSTRLGQPNFNRAVALAEELGLPPEAVYAYFQVEYCESAEPLTRRQQADEIVEFEE